MAIAWKKMKREELMAKAHDSAYVESLSDPEREKMQLDLCRRFNWVYTRPDGTKPLVPVTAPGDEK
jgi:hypothetical protein